MIPSFRTCVYSVGKVPVSLWSAGLTAVPERKKVISHRTVENRLSIPHTIHMLWNGEVKQAEVTEIFRPRPNVGHSLFAALQLRLVIEGRKYETSLCNTLQDAVWELQEITEAKADWWLRTCYHCQYAGQARDYATSDREYWCYRDVPDAFAEIQAKGKYASREALYAGSYFVNAFHVCAAWRPIQTSSAVDEES
jgi:hypothetical protein